MELRQLRYFETVADELHFTRAAKKLAISQPPLSQQIKTLERELGVDLLRRVGRRVELTDAGVAFLKECRAIRSQVVKATQLARDASVGNVGQLRIGVSEYSIYDAAVVKAFREFNSAYPGVRLELTEGLSTDMASKVAEGKLDLAVVRFPVPVAVNMISIHIMSERYGVIVPSDHRLSGESLIPLRALAGNSFVLFSAAGSPSGVSQDGLAMCRAAGFTPARWHEVTRFASAINLVALGLGVCIVTNSARYAQSKFVRYIDLEEHVETPGVGVITIKSDAPAKNNFIRMLQGCMLENALTDISP